MKNQKRLLKQMTAIVCAAMFMFSMSLFASTETTGGLEIAEKKEKHLVKNRKDEWDTNDKGEPCVRQCILPATYNCTYIDGLTINC